MLRQLNTTSHCFWSNPLNCKGKNGSRLLIGIRFIFSTFSKMKKDDFDNNPNLKLSFGFVLMVIGYRELSGLSEMFATAKRRLRTGASISATALESQNGGLQYNFYVK